MVVGRGFCELVWVLGLGLRGVEADEDVIMMSRPTLSRGLSASRMTHGAWSWVLLVASVALLEGGDGLLCMDCGPLGSAGVIPRLRRSESESSIGLGWVESERELHFEVCVLLEASEERAEVWGGGNLSLLFGELILESSNAARPGETEPGGAVAER